jgi:sec-independent protein translocase protein TatA
MRQLRDATNEVKREINQTAKKNKIDTDIIKDIKKEIHQVQENIEEYTGSIKRGSKF